MSKIISDNSSGEKLEELNIAKENEKLYEKLMQDLGFSSEKEKKPKPVDLDKAYQTISRLRENNINQKEFQKQKNSNKSLLNKIKEMQEELNMVSKEINDYAESYSDNILLKKEYNFNAIKEELKLYSEKLNNIINSDLYKNALTPKSLISSNKNELKNQIQTNLKNYTNSTARLLELISQEKQNVIYQKNMDIENELNKLEVIIGTKKLDMEENLNITQTLNKLVKIVNEKKFQLFKEKTLTELNQILDEVIKEKEISSEFSEYFIKLKELYAIYEVYENYDEVLLYIKKRLLAILDMHDKSTDFNTDLEFLKKIIEENEKQFDILGKRYSETFEELAGLENILGELKKLDKYFGQLLV